jgi:hypothetical protein
VQDFDSRICFVGMDKDGDCVPMVAFKAAYEKWKSVIQNGRSLVFKRVKPIVAKMGNHEGNLEIIIYDDTDVEDCVPLSRAIQYESDFNKAARRIFANVEGVIIDVDEETKKTATGSEYRPCRLADLSNAHLACRIFDQDVVLNKGDVVGMSGRYGKDASSMFVFETTHLTTHPMAEEYASVCAKYDGPPMKKLRAAASVLSDVETTEVGEVLNIPHAVVRTKGVSAFELEKDKGRYKLTFSAVDTSGVCVEVALFGDNPDAMVDAFAVGDAISFEGKVSSYHTRSLTTNQVKKLGADEDGGIAEWWKGQTTAEFRDISL